MKKKHLIIFLTLLFVLPMFAANNTDHLSYTLKDLRGNLKRDYIQMSKIKARMAENYESQHLKMVDIMKQCNELSLLLYAQKQEFTFDLCYALENVTNEFNSFEKDKMPYDRIVGNIDIEIDRYARLLESLRRLPPELESIDGVADSLLYHNDSLDQHHLFSTSQLELAIEAATLDDSVAMPFVLDEQALQDRDSCINYAKELLQMYFESKAILVADSIHYSETYLRLKESYDYASNYYKLLQHRIFVEGQTPWPTILAHFQRYWRRAKEDTREKYALDELKAYFSSVEEVPPVDSVMQTILNDTLAIAPPVSDTLSADIPLEKTDDNNSLLLIPNFQYIAQFFILIFLVLEFLACWLVAFLLLLPVFKWVKPIKRTVAKQQKRYISLLLGILIFIIINMRFVNINLIIAKAFSLANTFMWLLGAIVTALLIRLKPDQLKNGVKLYLPTICTAIAVIGCRILFIPNTMMNIIFPPLLIVFFVWQLLICFWRGKKADRSDRIFGWISLAIMGGSMLIAISGFIFASLLILVWWFFQLAAILTMFTIIHLIVTYKEKRMNPRISKYLETITMVTGQNKKTYLFRMTWFYDLVREVILPILVLTSLPFCLHLAMDVFDFKDLYESIFYKPFVQLFNTEGESTFRISLYSIVLLIDLFFIFRYANHAIHAIWQQSRYARYLKKTKRTTILKDEVNLSLGNSIINLVVWLIYIFVIFLVLHIPTGSLSLIAGGFSAGIGIALKDIINNFIYGIQLMSGRLKVGDWIECDGVRGKVTSINYQTTQVETINNTSVSFLNATLFAKNFTNLTKGSSYEFLKIIVGVAYGTDVQKVREIIENAMKVMCTKDEFGRDIVDPRHGVYVRLGEFSDSAINIAVKQYVLASEHIPYTDKAKEVIYNALNENGISIPFPQCDIHIITEESKSEE
jgi:small-conductance mechanosensitive channel